MTEYVKFPNSPLAEEGFGILLLSFSFTLFCFLLFWFLGDGLSFFLKWSWGILSALGLFSFLFSIWFFRNPVRTADGATPEQVLSAADGLVLKVETVNDPRYGGGAQKISIFMSPFDVHVNRAPVSGTVEKVEHIPGKFFAANRDKASTDNERNLVILRTESGARIGFLQIAGFIARRIVCHVKPGDPLARGQRYGMIRFGSRMEVFLPATSQVLVKQGDRVLAGKTTVARL